MGKCQLCGREYELDRKKNNHRKDMCNSCNTRIRRVRNKLRAIKLLGGKCMDCGNDNPLVLEFHHTDPTGKEFNIGSVSNKKWDSIVEEIKKCELLCANCHRIKHTNRAEVIAFLANKEL